MVYPLQERIKTNGTELARYGQIAAPLHVSNSQTAVRNFLNFSCNFARKKYLLCLLSATCLQLLISNQLNLLVQLETADQKSHRNV